MQTHSLSAPPPDEVQRHVSGLGFSLADGEIASLACYLGLLEKWNAVMNLVGTGDWRDTLERLVVDSLYLADFLEHLELPDDPRCWDLGAGAGLPGLPLRMVWQKGSYTMVEAREKRTLFLRTALAHCKVPHTTVARARVEAFFPTVPPADVIISRAFMPWPELMTLVRPHLAPGGVLVFLVLLEAPAEQLTVAGWELAAQKKYCAGGQERYFWALRQRS